MITIDQINSNGFDRKRLQFIENRLATNQSDIFIIAEHWFCDPQLMNNSPYFACCSKRPKIHRETGHENGGITLFCKPNIKNHLTILEIEEFHITFALSNQKFTTVYFPPRLHLNVITEILQKAKDSTTIFGDINVRFGRISNDSKCWNPERGKQMLECLSNFNFSNREHVLRTFCSSRFKHLCFAHQNLDLITNFH